MLGDYPHDAMDKIANDRFQVRKTDKGIYPYAVSVGNGEQEVYRGNKSDCENVSRKLAGAFLDGGIILAGIMEEELTDSMQPLDCIRWWIQAYSNPENGPSYQGHGMMVQMLTEYHKLRIALARWRYEV